MYSNTTKINCSCNRQISRDKCCWGTYHFDGAWDAFKAHLLDTSKFSLMPELGCLFLLACFHFLSIRSCSQRLTRSTTVSIFALLSFTWRILLTSGTWITFLDIFLLFKSSNNLWFLCRWLILWFFLFLDYWRLFRTWDPWIVWIFWIRYCLWWSLLFI